MFCWYSMILALQLCFRIGFIISKLLSTIGFHFRMIDTIFLAGGSLYFKSQVKVIVVRLFSWLLPKLHVKSDLSGQISFYWETAHWVPILQVVGHALSTPSSSSCNCNNARPLSLLHSWLGGERGRARPGTKKGIRTCGPRRTLLRLWVGLTWELWSAFRESSVLRIPLV